jgi:hypothetical protein
MHLYRVLEDEYIHLYGPLPAEYPWLFLQSHIKDRKNLIKKIKGEEKEGRLLDKYVKQQLYDFVDKRVKKEQLKLPKFIKEKITELKIILERDYPEGTTLTKQVKELESRDGNVQDPPKITELKGKLDEYWKHHPESKKLTKQVEELESNLKEPDIHDSKRIAYIETHIAELEDIKSLMIPVGKSR